MFDAVRKLFTGDRFVGADEGRRLDQPQPRPPAPPGAAQPPQQLAGASRAGQAALERFEKKQAPAGGRKRTASTSESGGARDHSAATSSPAQPAQPPLSRPPPQQQKRAEATYAQTLPAEPLAAAVHKLRFPATDVDDAAIDGCVKVLLKYLENALTHADDDKYRRIRLGNAVFVDKVAPVPGARALLKFVGFAETQASQDEGGATEAFLVLPAGFDAAKLERARELLMREPEFNRDVHVFAPSAGSVNTFADLPDSFYQLTREEAMYDIKARRAKAELEATLRTREMRERDVQKNASAPSPVACIRVRLPDGYTLQGRFASRETVQDVFTFVRQCLSDPSCDFVLMAPPSTRLDAASTLTLHAAQLTPAVLLHLTVPSGGAARLSEALLAIVQ